MITKYLISSDFNGGIDSNPCGSVLEGHGSICDNNEPDVPLDALISKHSALSCIMLHSTLKLF